MMTADLCSDVLDSVSGLTLAIGIVLRYSEYMFFSPTHLSLAAPCTYGSRLYPTTWVRGPKRCGDECLLH